MANASPSRLLALGVVGSIERKEGRFNTNSALRGLVAAGVGGGGCRWRGCADLFSQPILHSAQRALCSHPSMAHIACALRWKLNDSRHEIAAVEPLAKAHSWVRLCSCGRPGCPLPPPPPPPRLRSPAPPRLPTARSARMLVRHPYGRVSPAL